MLSADGGLVEYNWNPSNGWNWIEHRTPDPSVILVGSPGPCFTGAHLFLIGSDGKVYLRFLDDGAWKWRSCGFHIWKMKNMYLIIMIVKKLVLPISCRSFREN